MKRTVTDLVMRTKKCPACGDTKSWAEFPTRGGNRGDEPASRCKACWAKQQRENRIRLRGQYRDWPPEKQARHNYFVRNAAYKKRFGISIADYDRMLAAQGGGCGICGSTHPKNPHIKNFHVDHCHATNKVRGILCTQCNTTLGQMEERPDLLRKAAEYLEFHRGTKAA